MAVVGLYAGRKLLVSAPTLGGLHRLNQIAARARRIRLIAAGKARIRTIAANLVAVAGGVRGEITNHVIRILDWIRLQRVGGPGGVAE